ncbi:MAG: thioredoxin domain-containing protein [Alphaproteobacteria bacterium]|nr:thioredoxin domain-containing protein [Alphaproteobacteria bacterium]
MSPTPAPPRTAVLVHGAALALALPLSLVAGWDAVQLRYGAEALLCAPGSACATALTSDPLWISGAPLAVWAAASQVTALVVLPGALRGDERGRAARGALLLWSAGLFVGAVVAAVVAGPGGPLGLGLVALHGVALAALLASPGGRKPALPLVEDWLPALLIGLTAVMGFGFGARIVDHRLADLEEAQARVPELALPPSTDLQLAWQAGDPVEISAERTPVPIDDQDPYVGSRDADITAVAFVDLQDPASRALTWSLVQVEDRYTDRVRFVYKHLPMDASCNPHRKRTAHARSCAVALALQCAHAQRGFSAYRLSLLRSPDAVSDAELDAAAERIGLDGAAFAKCRASDGAMDAVEADIKQARQGPLGDPPWLFVEGRVVEGAGTLPLVEATLAAVTGEREIQAANMVVPVVPVPGLLPPAPGPAGMAALDGFAIDRAEAALGSDGAALSRFGVRPHPVDLFEARAACAAAGKRLCGRAEWLTACQGAVPVDDDGDDDRFDDRREGRLQPYGDASNPGWCVDGGEVLATGMAAACVTPDGVYDLAGNVAEWVEEGVLMGGGGAGALGCHQVDVVPGPGWRTRLTGFRCCADAAVADEPAAEVADAAPAPALPAAVLARELLGAKAADGPVLVLPWRTDCAPCQQALQSLGRIDGVTSVAVGLDADPAAGREWLERGGLAIAAVEDPEARIAGRLGVPGLPWIALYGADGALLASWDLPPTPEQVAGALATTPRP